MKAITRCLVILGLFVAAVPALAATPKFLGGHRDWNLYTYDDGSKGKVCYIASEPTKQEGNYSRRGAAAVLIAKWPGEQPQLSVQPGYTYLKDSTVELVVGKDKFSLYTQGEHAWASTDEEDSRLIALFKKGTDLTVRGTSTKKTYSLDTYSLLGFTAAYNAMMEACPD